MLKKCFKKSFILPIFLLSYFSLFLLICLDKDEFKIINLVTAIVFPLAISIISFIIEIIIYLFCKTNKESSLNVKIDVDVKGKRYNDLIDYYLSKEYNIDQLISRKNYLEKLNLDTGLDKLKSTIWTALITIGITEFCRNCIGITDKELVITILIIILFFINFSPLIFSIITMVKITTNYKYEELELNLVSKLIEIEQEKLFKNNML